MGQSSARCPGYPGIEHATPPTIIYLAYGLFSARSVRGHVRLAWWRYFHLTPVGDPRVRMWGDDDDDDDDNEDEMNDSE